MNNGRAKLPVMNCDPCFRNGVTKRATARANMDGATWKLCEEHTLSAAGCGFYPRRFGEAQSIMPQEAAAIVKKQRMERGE